MRVGMAEAASRYDLAELAAPVNTIAAAMIARRSMRRVISSGTVACRQRFMQRATDMPCTETT